MPKPPLTGVDERIAEITREHRAALARRVIASRAAARRVCTTCAIEKPSGEFEAGRRECRECHRRRRRVRRLPEAL